MTDKKCACPRTDARDCYAFRYAPMDDLQRSDFFSIMDEGDDKCECGCHEPDEWDDYEEDGPMDLEDQLDKALAANS